MAESQNVEYKEKWRDEYLKWVCGFANAQGGRIYIGLNDNGAQYIEIIVNPSSYPISYHGEYHYRSGSTKQQLRGSTLTEFLVRKTGYRWDAAPIDNVSVKDLDIESFEIFRREAVRTGRMTRKDLECTNEELLHKLGLITDGKLKRAAVLLFYRNPQQFFTGCYVKIGKFGIGSDLQYQDVVEGSLILIADRVVELIYLKYLKAAVSYDKEIRVETYPYAREAVREAVYNALIHCKWEDGIPIQIRIEEEAMYISNACVFPNDWTTENLMKTHNSRPYNPDLANTFFRAGYIEAWGRGIQKICEECDLIGAEIPKYSIVGDDITIKLSAISTNRISNRTNDVLKGNAMNIRVLEIIEEQKDISLSEIADCLGVSYKTIQRAVASLKRAGIVERIGGRRYGHWNVNKKCNK